jgi:hypothetical protein
MAERWIGKKNGNFDSSALPFSATQDLDHARGRILTLPPFCLAGPSKAGCAIPCAPSPAGRVSTTERSATRLLGVPALPEIPAAERYSSSVLDALHARQNTQKRAFASILGRWTSTVYSGVQGSPRQSPHLFPLVQSLLRSPGLPVRCNPARGLFHKKLRWLKVNQGFFKHFYFGESPKNRAKTASNPFKTRSNQFARSRFKAFLCKHLQMNGLQN